MLPAARKPRWSSSSDLPCMASVGGTAGHVGKKGMCVFSNIMEKIGKNAV